MNKINEVLKKVLIESKPSEKKLEEIDEELNDFLSEFKDKLKKINPIAEIFVGGSYAKKTLMKKDDYDVDIFVRFDKKFKDKEISEMTKRALGGLGNVSVIHGSRDYFKVDVTEDIFFEVVPVVKVKNPKESNNITDLSYFHVKYINNKIKTQKIRDDIILAKKFCYANKCYGAESYIKGFSGYALELLVYYYGGFVKFLKAIANSKKGKKIVVDIEKHHKKKQDVMMDLNSSKLHSPMILIDPTYKQRNALATLSDETFEKFKKVCQEFLKHPNIRYFERKKVDFRKHHNVAKKKKMEFIMIEAETDKQKGDIAGSKLLKFYEHVTDEIGRHFKIKNRDFEYENGQTARFFFMTTRKPDELLQGPRIGDKKHVKRFSAKHSNVFVRKGRVYAKEENNFDIEKFFGEWIKKNNKKIREMYITKITVLANSFLK